MVLQPRKFKYKSRHKIRKLNYSLGNKLLFFGQGGVILTQPLRVNSRKIFRIKLFLKKAAKRGDDTGRKIWLNAFPNLPLTKKVIGSRMGKGKGKLSIWHASLRTGHVFIEFKNLRNGRLLYYLKQTQNKLKSKSKILYRYNKLCTTTVLYGKSMSLQAFW